MPQPATSARYSRIPGSVFYIRCYIDVSHFKLSTPEPSPDFISDSRARLKDCFRRLGLPEIWLTSIYSTAYRTNETSPYHEAFYATEAEGGQVENLMEILLQMDPVQLHEAHLVALVLYQVKPDMAQARPCAYSDIPLAIAVNHGACTKYGLLALNHFANNVPHSTPNAVNDRTLSAPAPFSPPPPPPFRSYSRALPVNLTPLVLPGATAEDKTSKTA